MTNSENDLSKKQTPDKNIYEASDKYEDEISLIDYFIIFWKRKYLILTGSVLPTLMIGLTIFLLPNSYKITYIYNANLDEKSYKILLDKFYCAENLDKIITGLKQKGFEKYARRITGTQRIEDLKKCVNLEVSPSLGILLIITVKDNSQKDMRMIASVIRGDFEKVFPLYSVQEELISNIKTFKTQMADIEEGRFGLELELQKKKAVLEKLKSVQQSSAEGVSGNIILRFDDIGTTSAYLPLIYQVQAINSQIIRLEEDIRMNEKKFDYYKGLLGINEKILDEVRDNVSSYYTIREFYLFLNNIIKDYKDKKLVDYLDAYIKKIENKSIIPITKNPEIYPVTKGTVKKSGVVFMIAFMISTFSAFLLEGFEKSRTRIL